MLKRLPLVILAVLLLAGGWVLILAQRPAPTGPVDLRVRAVMGAEPLRLGTGSYPNPGGEGEFTIRDFQFYLSNVRLVGEDAEYREPDSYHLVRFDDEDGTFTIELPEVPREEYTRLEFAIGVDSAANASYAPVGDLDPNGRMAWGWEIGYKFVLVEGRLDAEDATLPLVYHVGFDENFRRVSLLLDGDAPVASSIDLCADLMRMFAGDEADEALDMRRTSNVTTERGASRLLADNYAGMVSRCSTGE
ncbi:MAG TPA: MbnP family protein, partial [Gemmatimonadota bacterium]|nr:MbnP family protein [Gemmatimonadota bacterium]